MPRKLFIGTQFIIILLLISLTTHAQNQNIQEDLAAVQSAHELYYSRKYSEAIEAYQALLKTPLRQNTKDSIRINMGQCYGKTGDDTAAVRTFQAIIDDAPDGSYASQAVHQIGNLFVQRYQYKEGILSCRQLANRYPKTQTAAIAHYLIAQYLYAEGKYDEAIKGYLHFMENFPNSSYRISALYSLVRLHINQREYAKAEELLRGYLRQDPNDTDLMEQLADLYKEQGKHSDALSLYRAALERDPNDTSLIKKLGDLYAQLGQRDKAVEQWSQIIRKDPNQSYRYQQLGSIYTTHQMYDKAIEAYESGIRLNPKSAYLYTQLANVYKIQGQIDMAIETYLRALRTVDIGYSGRSTIIEDMADIYEGQQRENLFERVITQVQTDLKAQPQNPNLVLSLAELYFYRGQLDLALKNFKHLSQLHRTDRGQILDKYAQLLERNKDTKAVDFYQTIVELFPNTRLAWSSQMKAARLYEQLGKWQEALTVLTNMKNLDTLAQLFLGHIWLHGIRDVEAAMRIYQPLTNRPLSTKQQWEVRLGLAECHILQERYAAAQNILRPIADGHSSFKAAARKLIGDSYLFQGKFEEATAEYKRVLEVAVDHPESNDALGRVVLIQSNSDYSNEPFKLYLKALQADLSGKADEALKGCKEAIEKYPKALIVDDLWMLIGEIHQWRQAYTDAIKAYQQNVTNESSVATEALVKIADIYHRQMEQPDKARATYAALIQDYPESVIVDYARRQIDEIVQLQSH